MDKTGDNLKSGLFCPLVVLEKELDPEARSLRSKSNLTHLGKSLLTGHLVHDPDAWNMLFSSRANLAERSKWVETELETKFPGVLKLFKGFIYFSIVDITRVIRTPVYFKIRQGTI